MEIVGVLFDYPKYATEGGGTMNVNRLRAKITERGETQKSVAAALGISENSLSRKLNGSREFKLSEALKICGFLHIENPSEIFFEK